jgi:hypothetical protein
MAVHLPRRIKLGLGPWISVRVVNVREMRLAAECRPDHVTPDGLWDDSDDAHPRILILRRLTRAQSLEVYFHELQHAVADVSYWVRHA